MTTEQAVEALQKLEAEGKEKPLLITFRGLGEKGHLPDTRTLGYRIRSHKNFWTPAGTLRNMYDNHLGVNIWYVT